MKDSLSLPIIDKQHLSITAFGSSRGRPQECEVICLAIRTKAGAHQLLEVFVVLHICDPLSNQAISICTEKYGHLARLDLADIPRDGTLEVDMLIRSDHYWEFVTGLGRLSVDPRDQLLLEQLLDGFSWDQLRLLDIKDQW